MGKPMGMMGNTKRPTRRPTSSYQVFLERKTGLEPATLTLAKSDRITASDRTHPLSPQPVRRCGRLPVKATHVVLAKCWKIQA